MGGVIAAGMPRGREAPPRTGGAKIRNCALLFGGGGGVQIRAFLGGPKKRNLALYILVGSTLKRVAYHPRFFWTLGKGTPRDPPFLGLPAPIPQEN